MKSVKLFLALLFIAYSITITAQEKEKSELNKKLDQLKGKVTKVTVQVEGKDVIFEGNEAETLVKKMKSASVANAVYWTARDKSAKGNYRIITRSGDDEDFDVEEIIASKIDENASPAKRLKLKMEKTDGDMKLTVIETDKEGKEVEKTYEGEEAEKYLKENGSVRIYSRGKFDVRTPMKARIIKGQPLRTVIIEKEGDDGDEKEIEATVVITKGDKAVKKDVIIEKKKKETKKENKEE